MTSRLTKTEFESRLKELTKKGEPEFMGTPFAILMVFESSGKPFYGKYSDNKFRITRNKVLPTVNGYIIDGYFSESGGRTKLEYEIKQIRFLYYWKRIAPILFFLFINGILLFNLITFQWDVILTLNGFLGFMLFVAFMMDRFQRKAIEDRFVDEFEVEN